MFGKKPQPQFFETDRMIINKVTDIDREKAFDLTREYENWLIRGKQPRLILNESRMSLYTTSQPGPITGYYVKLGIVGHGVIKTYIFKK